VPRDPPSEDADAQLLPCPQFLSRPSQSLPAAMRTSAARGARGSRRLLPPAHPPPFPSAPQPSRHERKPSLLPPRLFPPGPQRNSPRWRQDPAARRGNLRFVGCRKQQSVQALQRQPQRDGGAAPGGSRQQAMGSGAAARFMGWRGMTRRNGLGSWAGGASCL